MNRVHAASSTALLVGFGSVLWMAATASFAADASKSDDGDTSRAARQQRLDAAQKRLERAAQEVAELSMSLSEEEVAAAIPRGRQRAVLGVNIGSDEDDDREEGVEILSVSPGGGAAEAGLKAGDVLLAINDKALRRDDDGSARSKLLELMRSVKSGDKVSVKYRRDSRIRTVDVTTKPIATRVVVAPRLGRKLEGFEIPSFAFSRAGGVLGNAELVPLTPKLGQYFGTDTGLLVVRAPSDDDLELEEGDVILEIDGRAPNSTSHVMRILSSYQPGEKLTLKVMRKKRRTSIEFVVPESAPRARLDRDFERNIERNIERSLRNLPALQQQYRRDRARRLAAPAAPIAALAPLPPVAPLAPRPAAAPPAPAIEIQPLPEVEIDVETLH